MTSAIDSDSVALSAYNELVESLKSVNAWSPDLSHQCELYAMHASLCQAARKEIAATSIVVIGKSRPIINPAVQVLQSSSSVMRRILNDLGLSGISRKDVSPQKPPAAKEVSENDFNRQFNRVAV